MHPLAVDYSILFSFRVGTSTSKGSEDKRMALAGWCGVVMHPLMQIKSRFFLTSHEHSIPPVLFSIFLTAACLRVSPRSDSHSFNLCDPSSKNIFCAHPTIPLLCPFQGSFPMYLTDRRVHTASGRTHNSLTDGREVWAPPPRVCTSDCAPVVQQCSAMCTQARAGTSSLTPGWLIH